MFFSNKNVVAQVVRMADGHIVAAASTHEAAAKEALKAAGTSTSCVAAARAIGEALAQRAKVGATGRAAGGAVQPAGGAAAAWRLHARLPVILLCAAPSLPPPTACCPLPALRLLCLPLLRQAAGLSGVHWRRRHGETYSGKRKELIESLRAAGMPLV